MADEREVLRKRLGRLGLTPQREEEILRELGDHLEDRVAELEARGVEKDAAVRETLDSVSDWPEFREEIVRAETEEGNMSSRTKALWLPAAGAFVLSVALVVLLRFLRLPARVYRLHSGVFIPVYVSWLVLLPAIGAAAAWWSRRNGGNVVHRLLAATAPVAVWQVLLILGHPVSRLFLPLVTHIHVIYVAHAVSPGATLIVEPRTFHAMAYIVGWVLVPSLALLLGATPFLRKSQVHT